MLTDRLGYHQAMMISASLTLFGAIIALTFLPETRGIRRRVTEDSAASDPSAPTTTVTDDLLPASNHPGNRVFASAIVLYAVHRFAMAGVLSSTFGLFLLDELGDHVVIAGQTVGVATLTGLALALSTLIAAVSAPVMGGLSDRVGNRWRVAAGGLLPGVVGFSLLAAGQPLTTLFGLPLAAFTGGSNQGLSTALIGDLGHLAQGRRLGVLFTVGDLTSAIAPPLAYLLLPLIGINSLYSLVAGLFLTMFLVALVIFRFGRVP
jgi:MFS family permease